MTAVADVVTTYTADAIKARLLFYLQQADSPVTDWNSGAFIRSLMIQFQQALIDYVGVDTPVPEQVQLIAGGLPLLPDTPTSVASKWLTLVAEQFFNIKRNVSLLGAVFAGTYTAQNVTLTCDATHGPYNVTPGSLIVRSPATGNRYFSNATATVPNNGSVVVSFVAEFQSDSSNGYNYSDGAGTLTDLSATPLPGLSATNVAPNFSAVQSSPSPAVGLGVVGVSGATPVSATGYDILIIASGQVGTATFQYRSNGGVWSSTTATAATFTIPSGPTVSFTNDGGGANPSFIAGDRYYFTSPGSPITSQGVDPETDAALLLRCVSRWPDPTAAPVEKHQQWAFAASALVTRVRVTPDVTRPGFYLVTIAGKVNPLAGGVVTAVQLYINQHEGISEQSQVQAATVLTITANGTVFVPAAKLAATQAAAAAAWDAYVNATDIGGAVRLPKLEQVLRDAGATNVTGMFLNGGTNVNLTATQVASPADIIGSLTWGAI